jgi:hypothetical protein
MQALAFKMAPPATLTYDDIDWCPGSDEPPAAALPEIPSVHKMLFVLGSEHSGAEWLSNALLAHRSYIAPLRPHWCVPQAARTSFAMSATSCTAPVSPLSLYHL